MSNTLQFSVALGTDGPAPRPDPGQPMRILLLMDLGIGCRSRQDQLPEDRPIRPVDVDLFDTLLDKERPALSLAAGDLRFTELDDFHPDQIVAQVPRLQHLLALRRRLQQPAGFEQAAQEVRALLQADPATDADPHTDRDTDGETDRDTFSRLFGAPSDAGARDSDSPATTSALDALIREAVASHVIADADPNAAHYTAAVDAAASAHLRAILHDPAFQALEAAWRGLDQIVSNIETDEDLTLHVWNVGRSELTDAFGDPDTPLDASMLYRRLVEDRAGAPFTLIVTDMHFGPSPDDLRLLEALGAIAGRSGGMVAAPVLPRMLGLSSWQAAADDPGAAAAPEAGWTALRGSDAAQHIVALAPAILMRLPYGPRYAPVDALPFTEIADAARHHAAFLWGAPTLAATVLIARSFRDGGWDTSLSAHLIYDDLPLVTFDAGGMPEMKPCAEVAFTERAGDALLTAGIVPVMAIRHQNAVRLPGFRTIAQSGRNARVGPFMA